STGDGVLSDGGSTPPTSTKRKPRPSGRGFFLRSGRRYTFAFFQPPRLNSQRVNRPTEVSEKNTPQNTPLWPQPRRRARNQHSGIWISQKNTRLIQVGVMVSPAPLKACTETIHQP